METDLEKKWLSESYRNSLLLELKTINSEIEKADSPPSQSNFELLRDSLSLAMEIINSGSRDDYWIFIELWYSLSLVLATISEVDTPPLRLISEQLQSCPFFKEAILLRKIAYPPSQLFLDKPSHVTLKNKLYLYFCCSFGRIRYTLFEIELPISLRHPPTKATQDDEIRNPSPLKPILQLETSKYPDGMCCVQFGLELYFFGGKFMNVLLRDVYVFNLTLYHKCPHLLRRMNEDMLLPRTPMLSGKASPLAFMADAKIYVIGSNLEDSEDQSLVYFEYYDPRYDFWLDLPNLPISGTYKWVGTAVLGRKALLVREQRHRRQVYCFNLDTHQWTFKVRNSLLRNFTGKIEFVGNSFYGSYENTVLKYAVTDDELKEMAAANKKEEEEGGEKKGKIQQLGSLLCNYNRLRRVSKEKGMDAIYNVPRQMRSSTTLLHLGSGYFCYVRTGKPPQIHYDEVDADDIPSNRNRFTSIVIFQTAPRETYEENIARFFRAQFVYSKHYTFYSRFGEDVFIKGCYALDPSGPLG